MNEADEAKKRRRRRRLRDPLGPPDILYHATTAARVDLIRARGRLELTGGRKIYLSHEESHAWRVAHRLNGDPNVLYIDASRARRDGVSFERNGHSMWKAQSIEVRHLLNLRAGFAEQVSAGGIPLWWSSEGPKLALIRVTRRSGTTWEIAKGKMELGETPVDTALREVHEEMGMAAELEVMRALGIIRYGFHTPSGQPRLKTLHVYLFEIKEAPIRFEPSEREGIREVAWFTPDQAARAVAHRSLRPLMARLRDLMTEVRVAHDAAEE